MIFLSGQWWAQNNSKMDEDVSMVEAWTVWDQEQRLIFRTAGR